jgi:hypothetical protein
VKWIMDAGSSGRAEGNQQPQHWQRGALGETGGAEPTPRQYDDQSCRRTNCKKRRARDWQARPTLALYATRARTSRASAISMGRGHSFRRTNWRGGRWTSPTNSNTAPRENPNIRRTFQNTDRTRTNAHLPPQSKGWSSYS